MDCHIKGEEEATRQVDWFSLFFLFQLPALKPSSPVLSGPGDKRQTAGILPQASVLHLLD